MGYTYFFDYIGRYSKKCGSVRKLSSCKYSILIKHDYTFCHIYIFIVILTNNDNPVFHSAVDLYDPHCTSIVSVLFVLGYILKECVYGYSIFDYIKNLQD